MQANKNGFFYVLDRITGEFISAQPFSRVSWAKGIDPKTGRPIINPEVMYGKDPSRYRPAAAARTTGRRCRSIRRPVSSTFRLADGTRSTMR